jgi:WD40 repeat protein
MVWSVAFSPDGKRIVTGIAGAGATAKVWYAAPMRQMAALEQAEKAGEAGLPPGRNEH